MNWKQKIIDEFIKHYFASISETFDIEAEDNRTLRLRTSTIFPNFDKAHHNEKESFMEAAESLEKKGIARLNWEKHGKGERLKTLSCNNFEALFAEAGKPFPQTEAKIIREFVKSKINIINERYSTEKNTEAEKVLNLLENISVYFGIREIGHQLDQKVMEDFINLLEYLCNDIQKERITTRALSILLYKDSKHLENLLSLCKPLLTNVQKDILFQKKTVNIPDFSFLERSYPETLIAGNIFITFKQDRQVLFNDDRNIIGLPLETIEYITGIGTLNPPEFKKHGIDYGTHQRKVLTIENKETFYSLASANRIYTDYKKSHFDCYLYAGGYLNRAAAAMIKKLTSSGFEFYHAGDLDPDGILILQHIQEIANPTNKKVTPLRMDAATFDQHLPYARTLEKSALNQLKKIREETKAIPGIRELIQRIEETGLGVEQEIIDYR